MVLLFNKKCSTQQDVDIFGTIWSVSQFSVLQGGIVQAETAELTFCELAHLQQVLLPCHALSCSCQTQHCSGPSSSECLILILEHV